MLHEHTRDLIARFIVGLLFALMCINIFADVARTGHVTGLLLLASESLVVVLTIVRRKARIVHRSFALRGRLKITPADLFDQSVETPETSALQAGQSVGEMERKLIMTTLEQTNGNRTHAAKLLGISLRTLRNKLREYRFEEAAAI